MDQQSLLKKLNGRFWFRLYLLNALPAAFFSGLNIESVTTDKAVAVIKYSWFSKNPFRSIYFACLSMAGEMASGILALVHTQSVDPKVSMLVLGSKAAFHKKAVGKIRFICEEGEVIRAAVQKAIETKEGVTCDAVSKGYDESGNCVAEFTITWTFKQKNNA